MILLIDNYDSFSYNLYQLVGAIEPDIKVIRNDECTIEEIRAFDPERIILSPGPGRPEDAGVCIEAAKVLGKEIPVLGVCLGHQSICKAFGASVSYAKKPMHGKISVVKADNESKLFYGMESGIPVARYHSLAAVGDTIPEELLITAVAEDGEIMAVQHRDHEIYGVQFHPESILTPDGRKMIENFIAIR